ncbi:MAG TPA: hypothetical protein VGF36_16115 [Rhodopila sp.]
MDRLDQCQASCQRAIAALIRILPRRIQNENFDAARQSGKRLSQIGDTYRLKRYVAVAMNVGVDRDEIILPLELQAVTGEIDQRDGVGPGGIHLFQKFTKRFSQRCLIQIPRAGNGKTGCL